MTTTSEPSDRWRRLATAAAHYQAAALALAVAADFTLVLTGYWRTIPGYSISIVVTLFVMATMVAEMRHSRSLCERCAAKTPLDTEAAVTRNKWWLRTFHLANSVPTMVVLCLVYGTLLLLPVPSGVPHFLAMTPLFAFWMVSATANLVHRPLEPWCPQCDWDDGGDEELAPEPEPLPHPVEVKTH